LVTAVQVTIGSRETAMLQRPTLMHWPGRSGEVAGYWDDFWEEKAVGNSSAIFTLWLFNIAMV